MEIALDMEIFNQGDYLHVEHMIRDNNERSVRPWTPEGGCHE